MVERSRSLSNLVADKEDAFSLLSKLDKKPDITQRQLSSFLDISLGKTNYLLKELIKKGMIKVRNFSHKSEKVRRVGYILTPKGVRIRAKLTYHFLKRKEKEYNQLKREWQRVNDNGKEKVKSK